MQTTPKMSSEISVDRREKEQVGGEDAELGKPASGPTDDSTPSVPGYRVVALVQHSPGAHARRVVGDLSYWYVERRGPLTTVNKIIGAGIFSTPGNIFRLSGSMGMSMIIWVLAGLIATCGAFGLLELGTGIPRSGGLKLYLERAYSPRLAATCIYAFCKSCMTPADHRLRVLTSLGFKCHHLFLLRLAGGRSRKHDVAPSRCRHRRYHWGYCCESPFYQTDDQLFIGFPRTAMFVNNLTGAVKVFMLAFIICTGEPSAVQPNDRLCSTGRPSQDRRPPQL